MEGHQPLEEDDIGRAHVGRFLQTSMLYEGILWNSDSIVAFDEIDESLVGQVEIQGIGVIKVILCDVDLSLVDACISRRVLL